MVNNKALVSVIIPCYNLGQYIDEAVDSVLAQTYKNLEIIIVNDGSTDKYTNQLLSNYNKPKTTVFQTKNKGVSAARNYGVEHCNGEYLLALDADDKLAPCYLEKTMELADENSIVYTKTMCFGAKNEELVLPDFSIKDQLKQNLIVNTALYPLRLYSLSGGYDVNMKKGWEDWDFWLSLINQGAKVKKIDETLFYYQILPKSRNRTFNEKEKAELEQLIIKKHINVYRKYFPEPLTMLRELDALRKEKTEFEKYKQQIYNSASYKLGDFLLKPFKWMKKNATIIWSIFKQKNN